MARGATPLCVHLKIRNSPNTQQHGSITIVGQTKRFHVKQNIQSEAPQSQALSTTPSRELHSHLVRWAERMTDRRHPRNPTREQLLAGKVEQEVRSSISSLRQSQRGPTPKEWGSHYAMLALNFPDTALSPEQSSLKFQIFCADLAGIPAPAIAVALKRYRTEPSPDNKQKWRPQAWQILAMCEDEKRAAANILRACDEMERVLDAPPVTAPEPVKGFDASKHLHQLANRMRVRGGFAPRPAAKDDRLAVLSTARPCTDAAELREHIARRKAL